MNKNRILFSTSWIFILLLSCSKSTDTENLNIEKQILPIPIWVDNRVIKSSIYAEFPVVKNEISFDQFMKMENKGTEDKVLADYFNCFLRIKYSSCREISRDQYGEKDDEKGVKDFFEKDPGDDTYHKLFGFLPIGNRRIYLVDRSMEGRHFLDSPMLFRKSNADEFVHVFGAYAFYESYPMYAYWFSKEKSSEYKSIQSRFLDSKENNFIKLVPDFDKDVVGDKWYRNKGKMPVTFYVKGNEYYVNILDPDINPELLKQSQGLNLYHQYLKTIETGTKEQILDLFMRPKSYKDVSELTEAQMSTFKARSSKNGHIRFVVDADPVFFIFYSLFEHQRDKPESEDLGLVTIVKESDRKFKVGNHLLSSANIDDGLFSKKLFIDKILRPRVLSLFKKRKIIK